MRLVRLFKQDLAKEITSWVKKDIISISQAEVICKTYNIDYHNQSKHSYGYFILVAFGYLFIGLALLTLIGANWDQIPRMARMIGLIGLTLVTNLFGLYKYKLRKLNSATLFLFLGSLFYGASIMLIAQIYHIGEHYPDGIFWWALGVLPIALILQSFLVMLLATGLGFLWFFVETSLNYFPTLFPVFLLSIAWHLVKNKQSNILFLLFIIGVGTYLEYCLSWGMGGFQQFSIKIENIYLGFGICSFLAGLSKRLIQSKRISFVDYGTLLDVWILRFFIISLFVLSFLEPWEDLITSTWTWPLAVTGINIVFFAIGFWLTKERDQFSFSFILAALVFISCFLSLMFISNASHAIWYQVIDNLLLVSCGTWLIIRGIRSAVSQYFFIGIVTILLTGLFRYADLIGDYIGTAILFALFAAILLIAAKFWQHHHQDKETNEYEEIPNA